jgi:hypothetical protein
VRRSALRFGRSDRQGPETGTKNGILGNGIVRQGQGLDSKYL